MNTAQIFMLAIKIIIPIAVILIIKNQILDLNPAKDDNIIKLMAYIMIIAILAFIEISLFL